MGWRRFAAPIPHQAPCLGSRSEKNRNGSGTLSDPTINEWFDPTAFVQPTPSTFGNSGRNTLYGPGFEDIDLALSKSFAIPRLGGRTKLQFRADAFDVMNHPNFNQPHASIGSATAGIITLAGMFNSERG